MEESGSLRDLTHLRTMKNNDYGKGMTFFRQIIRNYITFLSLAILLKFEYVDLNVFSSKNNKNFGKEMSYL